MMAYTPVLLHLCFSIVVGFMALFLGYCLSTKRPQAQKSVNYECGFPSSFKANTAFYIPFYRVAILFIIFDIETVFFLPWAASLRQTRLFGWFLMLCFVVLLFVGMLYEWRKEMLKWS